MSTTDRQSERRTWLLKMRAEWFRVMRPHGEWVPWELRELVELSAEPGEPAFWGDGIVTEAPQLGDEHVRDCEVLPTRTHLLRRLPKGGIVAELGVLHGEFSRQIVEIVSPTELHLIDHHLEPRARALATILVDTFACTKAIRLKRWRPSRMSILIGSTSTPSILTRACGATLRWVGGRSRKPA